MNRTVLLTLLISASFASHGQTWRRAVGTFGQDDAASIRWVNEDLIVVVGSTGGAGSGGGDIYLMGLDGMGVRQWSSTIGGPAIEQAVDLHILEDGTYLILGNTNAGGDYDGLLIHANASGEVQWQRTYGGDDWDLFRELAVLSNGEVLVVGRSYRPGLDAEVWLLRLAPNGDVINENFYGGIGDQDGRSLCERNGTITIAGSTGLEAQTDVLLLQVDLEGNLAWSTTHGGDSLDVAYDVFPTLDGGFSIVGVTRSFAAYEEGYHLKTDGAGTFEWNRNWGQINDQASYDHLQLSNGEFITVGYTKTSGGGQKDMFLLKSSEQGDFLFGRTFGGAQDEVAFSLDRTDDGFLCAGWTTSYGAGGRDMFLIRTGENGTTATEVVSSSFDPVSVVESTISPIRCYPNPSTGEFTIEGGVQGNWRMFDVHGALIDAGKVNGLTRARVLAAPGTYLLEVVQGDGDTWRCPIVLQTK